jgi:hypothetical protein
MKLKRRLVGPNHPAGPSHGRDVTAIKRGLWKVESEFFPRPAKGFNDIYNLRTENAVKTFQRIEGIPASGAVGQPTLDALWPYMDMYARYMYRTYRPPKPKPPPLIEPNQGFRSLHSSLWEAFSLGRRMGLSDLGTYNPSSTLPSGAKSDHAVWPAYAFDLGVDPDNGFQNPTGRAFFEAMVGRPEVEYVILGNRIWSRSLGLHAYGAGGHDNHVHVSGIR